MEFLNRYRNLTVLLTAVLVQLVVLAYQVKSNSEVRLVRIWAVSAVTPLARIIEASRGGTVHFIRDYFDLLHIREENQRIKTEIDRIKLDNQFLRAELTDADRAKSLALFKQRSPSKTIAAHVVGNTTGVGAKVVIVDTGTTSGVQKGMAVITPDGIVGKVTGVYPTASYVLLITDPSFAAGVISQKNRVHGTLKGQGFSTVLVDYVQNEQKIEPGEQFFTSGEDRIFPKGLPVGQAIVARPGKTYQEVLLAPSGLQNGLEEVLIVIEGVHVSIPDAPPVSQSVHLQDPPPEDLPVGISSAPLSPSPGAPAGAAASAVAGALSGGPLSPPSSPSSSAPSSAAAAASGSAGAPPPPQSPAKALAQLPAQTGLSTEADRLVEQYRKIGEAGKHVYGRSAGGAPNFNIGLGPRPADLALPTPKLPSSLPPVPKTVPPPVPPVNASVQPSPPARNLAPAKP